VTGDLLVFIAIVAVAGGAGVALGMLLAPRIGRLAERGDDPAATEESADQREP
jgi:hypothetical protein